MNPMAKPARQRESPHIRAVYDYHPMFASYGAVLTGMGERFVTASGQPAAIGALTDAAGILAGRAGTTISA